MTKKTSQPKYLNAYFDILKLIETGIYSKGSKLPSEAALAQQYGISRMTLRQGLNLLQEDGFIQIKHGRGSFVNHEVPQSGEGLERKGKIVQKMVKTPVELKKVWHEYYTSDYDYIKNTFGSEGVETLGIARIFGQEQPQVYVFSIVRLSHLQPEQEEGDYHQYLDTYLEQDIYEESVSTYNEIQLVEENFYLKEAGIVAEQGRFVLIIERVYGKDGTLIAINKYYAPVEVTQLTFFAS